AAAWPASTAASPARLSDFVAIVSNAASHTPTNSSRILVSNSTDEIRDVVFKTSSNIASQPLPSAGNVADEDPTSSGEPEVGALRSHLAEMFNIASMKDTSSPNEAS